MNAPSTIFNINNGAVMTITKCLEKVQDFRKARGKIYSMVSVIKLVVAGLLYNKNNLKSIARFKQKGRM